MSNVRSRYDKSHTHFGPIVVSSKQMSYEHTSINRFLAELAAPGAAPAGGSGAALAAATGASLLAMLYRQTVAHTEDPSLRERWARDLAAAEALGHDLLAAMDDDAQAVERVLALSRRAAKDSAELQAAWQEATLIPLRIAGHCARLLDRAAPVMAHGHPPALADGAAGILLIAACLQAQLLNVHSNLAFVADAAFIRAARAQAHRLTDGRPEQVEALLETTRQRGNQTQPGRSSRMIEIRLYGNLRRHIKKSGTEEPVVTLPADEVMTVSEALQRVGVDPAEVSNVFLNGTLLTPSRQAFLAHMVTTPEENTSERRDLAATVRPGDRLGVFPNEMRLVYT